MHLTPHRFPSLVHKKSIGLQFATRNKISTGLFTLGLGLAQRKNIKKGLPSPRAGAGQENIETVHEPKPIQTTRSPWGQGRRAMGGPHGP